MRRGVGWDFGYKFHSEKPKPSLSETKEYLESLRSNWVGIVGKKLRNQTYPQKFTGRKKRRLVVLANPDYTPPWGSWWSVRTNPRAFTVSRKSINDAIDLHAVDYVDFDTRLWAVVYEYRT